MHFTHNIRVEIELKQHLINLKGEERKRRSCKKKASHSIIRIIPFK